MGAIQQALVATPYIPARTYATWNPADKDASIALSNGNLTAAGSSEGQVRSTIGPSTGKWYWEVKIEALASYVSCGVGNEYAPTGFYPGQGIHSYGYLNNGEIDHEGSVVLMVTSYSIGDVIGFAVDVDSQEVAVYKNNDMQYSGTVVLTSQYALAGSFDASWRVTANFGATPFAYTPPAGYNPGLYL